MHVVNDDNSIYVTRGDEVCLSVMAEDEGKAYIFQPGDVVRLKVFAKKDCDSVALQKDFPVTAETDTVEIFLDGNDTKIGKVISKPVDYWYEVELNPETNPITIIGYDEDGAKVFKLFPEGRDLTEDDPIFEPDDIPIIDEELDLTSKRPVQNMVVARAMLRLEGSFKKTNQKSDETAQAVVAAEAAIAVERHRIDNIIAPDHLTGFLHALDYLGFITEATKAKIDGVVNSDGVFATITVNLREANLVYGGTTLDVFIVPDECRPIKTGTIHTEDGLDYIINYDTVNKHYYLSLKASEAVTVAPSGAGSVTMTYALGDYETKDLRVGADGVIYDSAGTAIRDQLSSKVEYDKKHISSGEWESIVFPYNSLRLDANGKEYEEAGYSITDYIDLRNCYGIFRYGTGDLKYYRGAICFYDGAKNFIERYAATTDYEFSELNGVIGALYPSNSKAKYARLETENNRNFSYAFIKKFTEYELSGRFIEHPTFDEMQSCVEETLHEKGKIGVCFGDSLIQGVGVLPQKQGDAVPTKDVVSEMERILRCNLYNVGIGGTTVSNGAGSFCELVDAITTGDFTKIDNHIQTLVNAYPGQGFEGLTTQFAKLKELDFSKVNFVTISYGTNDWTAGKRIDNSENAFDKNTVCGGLRYGIKTLLQKYPHIRCYVFTPAFRDNLGGNSLNSNVYANPTSGLYLTEIADGIISTCKELHIPCKDMYRESNINEYNWHHYAVDGTHRNEAGYSLLGEQYAKFILSV